MMEALKKLVNSVEEMDLSASTAANVQQNSSYNFSGISALTNGTNTSNALFSQAALSQRIVNVEYYMTSPVKEFDNLYSEFRNSAVKRVPVIRIFGSTSAGQKVCANVHGVYPYISILDDEGVDGFDYKIATALDNAINDSVNTGAFRGGANSHKYEPTQHVFKVIRTTGKTFYGYRPCIETFMRIYFYNPLILKKAVDLLQSGNVLGRRFQPYEAHIPYSLQFMIDYCLYGMNYIHYKSVKFRQNSSNTRSSKHSEDLRSASQSSKCSISGYIDPDDIDESLLGPSQLNKLTMCELEVDVTASDIILETKVSAKTKSVNPGIDSIWKDEIERRRLQGVENCSQITVPESQERPQLSTLHSAEEIYMQTLCRKLDSFFESNDETEIKSANISFLNNSLMDDYEALPSSQVLDHLSGSAIAGNDRVVSNHLSQEEDEFVQLLEKMVEDPMSQQSQSEIVENPFGYENVEVHINLDNPQEDDEVEEENIWNDSLLNSSMLETLSDSGKSNMFANSETNVQENVPRAFKNIFQGDGQGGDSDTNSDESSSTAKQRANTRLSRRKSEIKSKEMPSTSKNKANDSQPVIVKKRGRPPLHKSESKSSPTANRLSLTLRRKSRSQETVPSQSQDSVCTSIADSRQPISKSNTRRSRSASVEKNNSDTANDKQSSIQSHHPGKIKVESNAVSSRPLTRRSLSVQKSTSKTDSTKTNTSEANSISEQEKSLITLKKHFGTKDSKIFKRVHVRIPKLEANLANVVLKSLDKPKRITRKPRRFEDDSEPASNSQRVEKQSESHKVDQEPSPKSTSQVTKPELDNREEISIVDIVHNSNESTANRVSSPSAVVKKTLKKKHLGRKRIKKQESSPCASSEVDVGQTHTISQINQALESIVEIDVTGKGKDEIMRIPGTQDVSSFSNSRKPYTRGKHQKVKLEIEEKIEKVKIGHQDCTVVSQEEEPDNLTTKKSSTWSSEVSEHNSELAVNGVQNQDVVTVRESILDQFQSNGNKNQRIRKKKKRIGSGLTNKKGLSNVEVPRSPSTNAPLIVDGHLEDILKNPATTVENAPGEMSIQVNDEDIQVEMLSSSQKQSTEIKISCEPSAISISETNIVPGLTVNEIAIISPIASTKKESAGISQTNTASIKMWSVAASQTEAVAVAKKNASISAHPVTKETGVQMQTPVSSTVTQTQIEMVSVETQTDVVVPLCLCQCTCITKDKTDAWTDLQEDLKPIMESKKIQVDNVDMITRARSARFTTPQGNKIVRTTPLKSPEKRKSGLESPGSGRRQVNTTPTPSSYSRYLSALVKTPTSHHKYRNFSRASPSTPKDKDVSCSPQSFKATPPSRESREGYLINSIRAASPRKRIGFIKPRTLDVGANIEVSVGEVEVLAIAPTTTTTQTLDQSNDTSATDNVVEAMEPETSGADDLSITSIYEYEESSPKVESSVADPDQKVHSNDNEPAQTETMSVSSFQRKRIQSKHRSKNRLQKRRAANLDANRCIPDIFEVEYEPLKLPASFKSTRKWLEAEKKRPTHTLPKLVSTEKDVLEESSDEETLPPPVKLFGGGNLSDDDDSDSDERPLTLTLSDIQKERSRSTVLKPFTPPLIKLSAAIIPESPATNSEIANETPKSILRQSGSSRRSNGRLMKRKIRWEDEEPCKRLKTEWGDVSVKVEIEDDSQTLFTNATINKTIDTSELDGPSFKNALGLENSLSNLHDAKALHQSQFLTTMCVELHCATRNDLLPNPAEDSVLAIFVLICNDYPEGYGKPKEFLHILLLDEKGVTVASTDNELAQSTKACASEGDLIDAFVDLVHRCDPDIIVGYEIEKSSLGYLIQRGLILGKELSQDLSRVLPIVTKDGERYFRGKDEWNGTIGGRIVLNLWRLLRHQITVQSYTFENAACHILHRRVYKFSNKTLTAYWKHRMHRHKVVQYYTIRVQSVIKIMDKLDLINRTSELARLFGIQFYEVLSRGSQFRVESMMLRATKPLDLIAPSPTVIQRAKMRAPEYLPLILEPRSNYYTDPVAVLDFQSLYPSMMIAYNYDYASLLGRVEHLGNLERFPLGCLDQVVSPLDLLKLRDHIHVSPAGVAFLDRSIVKGVVPEMLEQILETRQMVKRAMKRWRKEGGASLQKVLDSRQLGLKLIANVTYGYTSANFSGRMPCVEIADSIVSKGRETLQRAINHVKDNYERWGAEVVYGDTDSMFILFRGKSKDEAFKLAYEIADEVTQANPKPVKLKFEKIYQPCILQSKKRYVGFAYETPEQTQPTYDAKGIETVRRDGCPAVRKILEKTLHVLFSSNDFDKVERYVKLQFEKLFKGRVSMQDYIFAREFRGRAGYKPTASVPALEIAKRLVEHDPRAEPLVSERVPYVVVYGNPTLPLIRLVRTPQEYLENPGLRLNAHYYIEKAIIPALNRCLMHAGMNPTQWYLQLPRRYLRNVLDQKTKGPKGQGTLDDYILHHNCLRCDGKAEDGLCPNCLADRVGTVIHLQQDLNNHVSKLNTCIEVCKNCAGETDHCLNIDCPVLHKLTRYRRDQPQKKLIGIELDKLESLEW